MNLYFPYFVPDLVDPFGNTCVTFEYPPIEIYTKPKAPYLPLPYGAKLKVDGRVGFTSSFKGKHCDKCCPDGRRVSDMQVSVSGKFLIETRMTIG